jgi:hypothetical protein
MDDKTLYDLFGSLSREVQTLRTDMIDIKDGVQRIETRLDRQGGIINGGTRQISRLITWSEEMDALQAERDGRIQELMRRVERLEQKSNPGA